MTDQSARGGPIATDSNPEFIRFTIGALAALLAMLLLGMAMASRAPAPAAEPPVTYLGATVPGGTIILSQSRGGCPLALTHAAELQPGTWVDRADGMLRMSVCASLAGDEFYVIRADGREFFVPARDFKQVRFR